MAGFEIAVIVSLATVVLLGRERKGRSFVHELKNKTKQKNHKKQKKKTTKNKNTNKKTKPKKQNQPNWEGSVPLPRSDDATQRSCAATVWTWSSAGSVGCGSSRGTTAPPD